MQEKNYLEKTFKIALIIFLIFIVIFSSLAFLNYSLIIGFVIGGAAALVGYNLDILIVNKFFDVVKTKKSGFWLGWTRHLIILTYHAVLLIGVIAVNRAAAGEPVFHGTIHSYLTPINLLTYAAGIGIIPISILVTHILQIKGGKHGN